MQHIPASRAIGTELADVIYWMDIWFDASNGSVWGIGDIFFGNVDRVAGTMPGIVFDDADGVATFSGTKVP